LLNADEQVTKIEVAIEGEYLNQIVIDSFDDFYIELDTIQINPGTEVMVFAYDKYLNYSSQSALPVTSQSEYVLDAKDISITCFPNPFYEDTRITFELKERVMINLAIYDSQGILVKVLENKIMEKGCYEINWDTTNVEGLEVKKGIYFCTLKTNKGIQTMKMIKI
jgi:hypothetical protein